MRMRDFSYAIKVFEAQWDNLHDESVKPFFAQLKRETQSMRGAEGSGERVSDTTPSSATASSRTPMASGTKSTARIAVSDSGRRSAILRATAGAT